jgi:hypothetical protein
MKLSRESDGYLPLTMGGFNDGFCLYKIVDAAMTGKKPFDITGISPDGKAVAIECKYARTGVGVEKLKGMLEPHQMNWINTYAVMGGVSIVVLFTESGDSFAYRVNRKHEWEGPTKLEWMGKCLRGLDKV